MMTEFSCIIFLKILTMVSNFKFILYFNILQNFVQNVKKSKWPSILSCSAINEEMLNAHVLCSFENCTNITGYAILFVIYTAV